MDETCFLVNSDDRSLFLNPVPPSPVNPAALNSHRHKDIWDLLLLLMARLVRLDFGRSLARLSPPPLSLSPRSTQYGWTRPLSWL